MKRRGTEIRREFQPCLLRAKYSTSEGTLTRRTSQTLVFGDLCPGKIRGRGRNEIGMKGSQIVLVVSLLTFVVLKPLVAFPEDRGGPPPANGGQRQNKV